MTFQSKKISKIKFWDFPGFPGLVRTLLVDQTVVDHQEPETLELLTQSTEVSLEIEGQYW